MMRAVSCARASGLARWHPRCAPAGEPGLGGLGAPRVVQRDVGAALDALVQVPIGLAVAHDRDACHRAVLPCVNFVRGGMCRGHESPSPPESAWPPRRSASSASISEVPASNLNNRPPIALGGPAVDHDDRLARAPGLLHQADAGIHGERGAGDDQRVGGRQRGLQLRRKSRWERTRRRTRRWVSASRRRPCSRGSTKPSISPTSASPSGASRTASGVRQDRVCRLEPCGDALPPERLPAGEAHDRVHRPVQFDDPP